MKRFVVALAILAMAGCNGEPEAPDAGLAIAQDKGCAGCHSSDGSESVGPTWKGLFGSRVELDDGTVVTADEDYLRESMLMPSAKTVKGFQTGLMETVIKPNSLSNQEVEELIAYIKTLK